MHQVLLSASDRLPKAKSRQARARSPKPGSGINATTALGRLNPLDSALTGKDGLDRFLTYRLHVLNKLTDQKTNELYQKSMQLTLSDCRCLAVVGYFYPVSVNNLALYSNLDKSQASRAAQRLVAQGLIARQSQEGDSRIVNLVVTKNGQRAYNKVIEVATKRNNDVFAVLSPNERKLLSELLDKLIDNAQST